MPFSSSLGRAAIGQFSYGEEFACSNRTGFESHINLDDKDSPAQVYLDTISKHRKLEYARHVHHTSTTRASCRPSDFKPLAPDMLRSLGANRFR